MKRIALIAASLALVFATSGCTRVTAAIESAQPTQPVTVTIVAREVGPEVGKSLKVDDVLRLKDSGGIVGKIVSLDSSSTVQSVPTAQGSLVATASPIDYDVTVTVEASAVVDDSGIRISGQPFFINEAQKFATNAVQFSGFVVGLRTAGK